VTFTSKQFGLLPEGFDQGSAATHAPEGVACVPAQLGEGLRAEVGQLMLFAVAPDVLNRIELGSVGGQELDVDRPLLCGDIIPDQTAAMGREPVSDDRQFARKMPAQMAQETHHLRCLDGTGKELEIEVPNRDPGDGREAFPVERILQHRSLPTRGPSPYPVRALTQAALIHEHYGAALLTGFFFIAGHRTCFQRWIAGSFLWVARPVGRWQLHPKERRIRQTWPLDQVRHPPGGPQACAVSQNLGPFLEPATQGFQLGGVQPGLAASPPRLLEPGLARAFPLRVPPPCRFP
jgi:hypothetical protein